MTHLSVVIPVYNESSLIAELTRRVKQNIKLITEDFEIILVDDGSKDETWKLIVKESMEEKRIKGIKFSRNFGHHYAITAGLHSASGDWVVVMDGDLQDRPEVIPDLYKKAISGYDVVFVSRQNRPEKLYYRIAQRIFYFVLNSFSGLHFDPKQANFSILNTKVVKAFMSFPENSRFFGSTVKWLGFNRAEIFADHGQRFSGRPSYTFKKRIKLATDIIISFSERPSRILISLGLFSAVFSTVCTVFYMFTLLFGSYTYITVEIFQILVLYTFSICLTLLGFQGIYIREISKEVKKRPLYIIDETV
jgi:dolichol-phosphate mannosyltransferase